jgi:hypothetical protein
MAAAVSAVRSLLRRVAASAATNGEAGGGEPAAAGGSPGRPVGPGALGTALQQLGTALLAARRRPATAAQNLGTQSPLRSPSRSPAKAAAAAQSAPAHDAAHEALTLLGVSNPKTLNPPHDAAHEALRLRGELADAARECEGLRAELRECQARARQAEAAAAARAGVEAREVGCARPERWAGVAEAYAADVKLGCCVFGRCRRRARSQPACPALQARRKVRIGPSQAMRRR